MQVSAFLKRTADTQRTSSTISIITPAILASHLIQISTNKALANSKNIVIPTMSAGYANQIYDELTIKYPELKVVYTLHQQVEKRK